MPTMLKRPRFLFMLMLLVTILAGGVQWALSAPDAKAAPAVAAPVLAAGTVLVSVAGSLPPGHMIQPGDLAELPWRSETLPAGAIAAGSDAARALVGSVTRRAFASGELILPGAVILPGEHGFLSALIAPGHRAIAVAVEASTAAGGLIWPGDRVDVILTQELRDDNVPLGQRVLSETILSDARILSTDQKLDPAAQTAADPAAIAGRPGIPATITLEVTPADAERVTVAGTLGRLHITLRAVASEAPAAPSAATWAGSVSPGLATVRRQPAQSLSAAPVMPAPAASPAASSAASGELVRIYRGSNGVVK